MKLVCEKITKRFGSNLALQDVDLTINGGEIRALLGGNGSGKSTLSKILGGALYVTSGKMKLNGSIYAPKSPIEAKRAGVVFTSQELSLFDNLTVEENIAICTYSVEKLLKNEKKKTISKVHALLQKYGLEHLASKKVKNLSANEQYLIEFMKAVYQKTDVLIIDEITSALYKEDVEIVERVMNDFKAEGKIILFISHRMPEIMELCDTVTVLRNGNVVATHNTKDVSDAELVSEMTGLDISKVAVAAYESNIQNKETEVLLSVRDMSMPHFDATLDLDVHAGEIITVVEPTEVSSLLPDAGGDYVTLLTCTPYVVNTQRLLVRGHRVAYEPETEQQEAQQTVRSLHTSYVLWVAVGLGVTLVFILLLWRGQRSKGKRLS